MAVVLPSDDSSYFRSSSSLRRSHSQTTFSDSPATYRHASSPNASSKGPHPHSHSYHSSGKPFSDSPPSSASSSPRVAHAESTDLSCASTPASTFSFASDFDDTLAVHDDSEEEEFGYPSFFPDKLFINPEIHPDDNLEPPPSPRTGDSYTVSPADQDSSENTSRPGTPDFGEHAEDDTAVTTKPTRQVDYLSHDWREEADIWSSWRYIVARRGEFSNSTRLENASWRTWMKSKNNLKTISPETLNWLKDCDVTWLYGPLQSRAGHLYSSQTEPSSTALSKTDSLINLKKKPILKKRSMSEIMLQRSLTAASLLKQATAAVQAQETRGVLRPQLGRANTDYDTYPFSSRRMSQGNSSSVADSTDSSGITSPSAERKHIHFNEHVEQCIAVDVKGDDDDDMDFDRFGDDSDSSDGVMMKRMRSKKRVPSKRRSKRAASADGKIIAMLPSTTLKEDTPEPKETAMKHSTGPSRGSLLSPSSSQETLRPAKQSNRFYFGEEDDDMEDTILGPDSEWRSASTEQYGSGVDRSGSTGSLFDEPAGMRRTPSGMFMPYEEDEAPAGEGIFGRVIDTVNTARDIAHVIWNVGWRK